MSRRNRDDPFAAGQVWSYRTRPHERDSRVTIAEVDELDDGRRIFHVWIDGLAIANPEAPGGLQRVLAHAPVSADTLRASLVEPLDVPRPDPAELADYRAGYLLWREAFDAGDGGFFLMPLNEVVQYVEDILTGVDEGG